MLFRVHFILCISVVSTFMTFAYGKLSEGPQNTEAVIGSSVKFTCRTLETFSVNWEHTPIGSKTANDIYISMAIVRPYDAKISMKVNRTTGDYELTIASVKEEDAGRYECIDEAGHGDRQGAELVVLVSHLVCQENIDPDGVLWDNDCGLEPDNVEFQCVLPYSGNINPVLKWRKTEGELVTPKTVIIDRTEHKVTMMAAINPRLEMDGSSYTCETSLSQHAWTSSTVKLLYAFNSSTVHEIDRPTLVNCSVNSSQSCQFVWVDRATETNQTFVAGQSAVIDKPGSYLCVAECTLRGQTCRIQSTVVKFSDTESVVSSWQQLPLLGSVVAGLATVVVIIISVYLSYSYIERKRGRLNFSSKLLLTSIPRVQGIAAIGKDLYIIHQNHKAVSIYRSDYPYDLRKEIKAEEFSDPRDIAAYKNYLYITDGGKNCVWKMGLNQPKHSMTFIENIGSPFTISISADGEIVLAQNPNSINVYNLQGQNFRSVHVRDGIRDLQHAFQTRGGKFIISHGYSRNGDSNITLLASDGYVIEKYTGKCEQVLGPLNQPSHIAAGETGSVYVADVGDDKIIVLNEDLNPVQVVPLLSSSQPTRLCYKDGQLLVGDRNGAVQFFGVDYLTSLRRVSKVFVPTEDLTNDTEESSLLQNLNQPAEN